MEYIDLHTHSYYSDGTMSPTELVELAYKQSLKAIALTDHDTTDGLDEFVKACKKYGVEAVTGIEFSVVSTGETHILGYNIDYRNEEFATVVEQLNKVRAENNVRTQNALRELGFDVTVEDVRKISPVGNVGRLHFAKVMVEKGYVKSVGQAFDLYLQKGRPAYNGIRLLNAENAIKLIKKAGGKAYLAHLHLTKMDGKELEDYLIELKGFGLDGIEGYYTEYTPEMQEKYQNLAKKYGLSLSGGSDFHGHNKPDIELGKGYGNLNIPYSIVEEIKNL